MASLTGGQFVFAKDSQAVHLALSTSATATNAGTDYNIEVFVNPGTTTLPALAAGFDAGVILTDTANSVVLTGPTNQELLGGQTLTLFTGDYQVTDASVAGSANISRIQAGSGNQTIVGAPGDTLIGGAGSQVLFASSGHDSILGGSGPTTVFGSFGDSVAGGSGNALLLGFGDATSPGGVRMTIGSGSDTVFGAVAGGTPDTILGGSGSAYVQALGKGDIVDFSSQAGSSTINGTAGNIAVTLGGGASTVFGAVGDSVQFGSTGQFFMDPDGGASLTLGDAGTDTVFGSGTAGSPDTIVAGIGQNANLLFNPGSTQGGGELINLAGHVGADLINAFQFVGTDFATNDTIIAGNGTDSIWGGGGDRIGVGDTTGSAIHGTEVAGNHIWTHSDTTAGSAVQFGSNDTVAVVSYDTVGKVAYIPSPGPRSNAVITIGIFGDTTTQFNTTTDSVFYANQSTATDAMIRATAVTANGSTTLTLPDATQITLAGVADPSKITFTK